MAKGMSVSSNPPAGEYAIADGEACEWCERPAEWRFKLGRPRIASSINRNHFAYGCGIHWKQALRYAEGTKK